MRTLFTSFIVSAILTTACCTVRAQTLQLQAHTTFGWRGDGSIQAGPTPSGGDYYWLASNSGSGTGDNLNRGMAHNPLNNHLYIPFRTNSTSAPEGVHILDGTTGAEITPGLDISGITNGGTITLIKIDVADDGVIYAMNFGSAPGTKNTVYRWSDETSVATVAFAGNPAPTTSSQWGYTFDVRGAGPNTQILLTTSSTTPASGRVASLLTTADGTNFTARQLNTDAEPGSIGYYGAAAFGPGNTFWAKSLNNPLQYFSFDTNAGTATVLKLYDLNEFPATIGPFGVQLANNRVAGVDVSTPDSIMLFSFASTTGDMAFLSRTNAPTDNINRYGMGSVIFKGNMVYSLDCNNGVWALDIVSAAPPPSAPYISGPVLRYGPAGTNLPLASFVSGSPAPTIRWQVSHSISNTAFVDIPGATTPVLTLTNLQVSDEGLYHLVASNEWGVLTSVDAQVLVFPDTTGMITPLWSLAPGSRPYVTPDATSTPYQRALTYNALSNQVIIVSRTNTTSVSGLTINVINATTGADLYKLDKTDITGGSIILLAIAAADDGAIYACNQVNSASATTPLKIYRWANSGPGTVPALIFTNGPSDFFGTTRWGDTLAVRGSGINTELLLDDLSGTAAILKPTDATMLTWTSTVFTAFYGSGTIGRSLEFGLTNTIWQKKRSNRLLLASYEAALGIGLEQASYEAFSTNLGPVALNSSRQLLAGIEFATVQQPVNAVILPDMLVVYNVEDLANPRLIGRFPMPAGQTAARPNANSIAQVIFQGNRLYAVEGNNGIMGFTVPYPTLDITRIGSSSLLRWASAEPGYKLQATPALSGGWTNLPQTATNINSRYLVSDSTAEPMKFYRLKK